MRIKLYSRYRNSAGQRVRIALNIKNIDYEYISVPLDGGVPASYRKKINPQGLLPSLVINNDVITQSTAQIEFLEENFSGPSLFPDDPIDRAHSRAFSQIIACEIHPVIGPKIQRHLIEKYKLDNESRGNADSSEGSAEINQLHIQLLDMLKQVNIFIELIASSLVELDSEQS